MKIGIFTPYSLEPMHPRIEMYLSFFKSRNIEYHIELPDHKRRYLSSLLSKAFINIFDFAAVKNLADRINNYDYIFIQDLKYLPLCRYAKKAGKRVIYETLDNSVSIRVHSRNANIFFFLIRRLSPIFSFIEKSIAKKYVDKVIVNSEALKTYFNNRAELIFYASPFESAGIINDPKNTAALIYLGAISYDKGILDLISLTKSYQIKTFIFGDCQDEKISSALSADPLISWKKHMKTGKLKDALAEVTKEYFLIGLSLIKPVHYSYATQEANKEIDYMSMGIPFIGNHRMTTSEKIIAGCGVFCDDSKAVELLINDQKDRAVKSVNCRQYYLQKYAIKQFDTKVENVLKDLHNG